MVIDLFHDDKLNKEFSRADNYINKRSFTLNADIEELDVETGAGSLDFYGTVEKEVDIDCGAGRVTLNLEGKVEDYNYELDSSAGSVEIGEDIDLGGLSTEKSIDNGSKRTIEISNGAGSVEIRFH